MPQITKTEMDELVQEMNDEFQPKSGECKATPAAMLVLVQYLSAYTKEVQEAALFRGIDDDSNQLQWQSDMSNWLIRLSRYEDAILAVPTEEANTPEGCAAIYKTVTAPLLDGIYYEALPGINFSPDDLARMQAGEGHPGEGEDDTATPNHPGGHSNPKPNDVITPFTLGNQVLVYSEHQKERVWALWTYVKEEARALAEKVVNVIENALDTGPSTVKKWGKRLLAAGAVVGVGYVGYRVYRGSRRRASADE